MNYQNFFHEQLKLLKNDGRYRYFTSLTRSAGNFPHGTVYGSDGQPKDIIVWCGNDYLGMGQNPQVLAAMHAAIDKVGAGSGGTRNISGTTPYHQELERSLADFHEKEAALIFTSGYVANEAALQTLGTGLPECVFFSDAHNHASIIQGIRYSRAQKHIFDHNNVEELESQLRQYPLDRAKIIVFESVYSMNGDIGKIQEICTLAKKYNALTYLDEVHGVGMYGVHGAGIAQELGLVDQVDFIQGTLGKAFGLIGGYVTADAPLIDYIRSFASSFIFTTSLPPFIAAGAIQSIKIIRSMDALRTRQHANAAYLKKHLKQAGIPFMDNPSHIVPIIVGDPFVCKSLSQQLIDDHGIYIQPINFPTVPKGTERFRVTPSAVHTFEMIDHLVGALKSIWQVKDQTQAA